MSKLENPHWKAPLAAREDDFDFMGRAVSRSDLARWAIKAMAASIPSATMDASSKSS